jgi:uncharacterized protein
LSPLLHYADSSALARLVVREAETPGLESFLRSHPLIVTSEIATVEVRRAARQVSGRAEVGRRAEQVLAAVNLLRLDAEILEEAARLDPPALRTLDAIHLATALSMKSELAGFLVYDEQLASAARKRGIRILAPA